MQRIFSTDELDPGDRFRCWMDVVSKNLIGIDSKIYVPNFSATIHAAPLAQSTVGLFELDDCELRHGTAHISRSESDDVVICLQLEGKQLVTCGHREAEVAAGDIVICGTQVPYDHMVLACKAVTLRVPRALFERHLGDVRVLSWLKLPRQSVVAHLARRLIARLPQHCAALDGETAALLEGQIVDLMTLAYLGGDGPPGALQNCARALSRFRLASTIESHLFDARLKPVDFAEKAGMSTRHANTLLAADGTSLERYVFARRLARSQAVLKNPVFDFRSLSEIAYSHGFANQSHFSRKFKEAYGVTPSEHRQRLKAPPTTH